MNHCEFPAATKGTTCTRCGYALHRDYPSLPSRVCDRQDADAPKPGLGDRVAHNLERVGITKPLIETLVGGDCGCDDRQEWLNQAGRRFGL